MTEKLSLLYADPPWRFNVRQRETGLGRAPDRHYETASVDDLSGFLTAEGVEPARDALLVMWVYDPMLPDALRLAEAWGFSFVTVCFRWMKTRSATADMFGEDPLGFGLGYHTRAGGCEECWLFKRGRGLPVLRHDIRREFYAPIREHSRKPDEVAGWLVDLYGDVPRAELFARTTRPGWRAVGNETSLFSDAAA